ncbi:hypothetical protein Acr_10g0010740 [Actinidia rufa]|uniref:Uncharacterized protein n=1 Tax=Actinidia rufa TaxID=165716 RepID=A0A7J0FBU9_9ERIC|nr:hypothetical protein Acr_10g0010740 [Actinidia rufa]
MGEEVESYIVLIHGRSDEIPRLAYRRGGSVKRSEYSGGSRDSTITYSFVASDNEALLLLQLASRPCQLATITLPLIYKAKQSNLENSLPSWIVDHLGEKSFMANEVTQPPSSPREDPPSLEGSPSVATPLPFEKETNITTQDELDHLRESHSFPPNVQMSSQCMAKSRLCGGRLASTQIFPFSQQVQEPIRLKQKPKARFQMALFQGKVEEDPARGVSAAKSHLFYPRLSSLSSSLEAMAAPRAQIECYLEEARPTYGRIQGRKPGSDVQCFKNRIGPAGKLASDAKDKGTTSLTEGKKKSPSKVRASSNKAKTAVATEAGTSANLVMVLGSQASILKNLGVAEKLIKGLMVLTSSLAGRGREMRDEAMIQQGRVALIESEMTRAQKLASNLERLEAEVAELRKGEALSKKKIIEEFRASDDFEEAVELTTFRYFGEDFNFYKRQLCHHHPDLNIDLEGMGIDVNLLEEEEEDAEKKEEKQ